MIYYVLGEKFQISSMDKPNGCHGSVFEFKGNKSLNKIGLKKTFYFQMPNKFSVEYPSSSQNFEMKPAETELLDDLSFFLDKCIRSKKLISQFSTSVV